MKNRTLVHTPAQTPDELLQELRQLIKDAEGMLGESVKEHSAEAIEALRTRYEAARARVAEACANARRNVVAGARYADETIRDNPYESMAVAAGVGMLVGVLLARRGK